jgi:FkbM family methyltransferase
MIKKTILYFKAAMASDKKLFHIKIIVSSWYYVFININQIRRQSSITRYFSSEQYSLNKWTLSQSKNYGKDFSSIFNDDDFIDNMNKLLTGLESEDKKEIKFILQRMIFLSFLDRKEMFSDAERNTLIEEVKLINLIKKENNYYSLLNYKFINNNMTIHNFIDDLGLKKLNNISFPLARDILDVGAYIGDSALILSNYTTKKVYAFEPFKDGFDELTQNISLNNNKTITPVNLGISDKNGKDKLYFGDGLSISTNDPETSLSKGACTKVIEIENVTIDTYVKKHNLDVGIIKIDAEGAEPKVLQGAKETIVRQKPILLISIYHNINDFMFLKPWVDELNLGYKYKITKPEATTFIEETMLICYVE